MNLSVASMTVSPTEHRGTLRGVGDSATTGDRLVLHAEIFVRST